MFNQKDSMLSHVCLKVPIVFYFQSVLISIKCSQRYINEMTYYEEGDMHMQIELHS
jgi:hypothetical protein